MEGNLTYLLWLKCPVTSASIRWIKITINEAGLEGFDAHYSRGEAATAAAMAGISTQEILSRAGWSNKGTFTAVFNVDPQKQMELQRV